MTCFAAYLISCLTQWQYLAILIHLPRHALLSTCSFPPNTVAVKALMSILRDASLAVHHGMVTQAVMFIFKSLGLRCVPFLEHILPNMLHVVRR